jgi:hypothetical protein
VIGVEGIEHGITAQPFLAGDAAIAIEIIEQEDLLRRMLEGARTFQLA